MNGKLFSTKKQKTNTGVTGVN